jgi:hypothetical protein
MLRAPLGEQTVAVCEAKYKQTVLKNIRTFAEIEHSTHTHATRYAPDVVAGYAGSMGDKNNLRN